MEPSGGKSFIPRGHIRGTQHSLTTLRCGACTALQKRYTRHRAQAKEQKTQLRTSDSVLYKSEEANHDLQQQLIKINQQHDRELYELSARLEAASNQKNGLEREGKALQDELKSLQAEKCEQKTANQMAMEAAWASMREAQQREHKSMSGERDNNPTHEVITRTA
jgi:chromosome segregation ATPase